MRILVFGDSIAEGQWDTQGGWVERLRHDVTLLHLTNPSHDTHLLNLSIGGNTTREVIDRLQSEVRARTYWLPPSEVALVFAVGVNDTVASADGRPALTIAEYGRQVRELHDAAAKLAETIIFVGLLPVDEHNPALKRLYRNERIWQFEQLLRAKTAALGCTFVPVYEVFLKGMHKGERLHSDGIHPNDNGHKLLYAAVKPALERLF